MSKTLLKIYFPYTNNNQLLLPIEVDILNSEDFNKSLKNIRDNFSAFASQIIGDNSELEIETEISKCKFEKISIEEININQL